MAAGIVIDPDRRTVTIGRVTVRPTKAEFGIVVYLAAHPGFVRSREQLMDAIGLGDVYYRTIDSHVKRLRAQGVTAIKSSRGVGYYWED